MRRSLYITIDGVLQPLGHSQVIRILLGLGPRGLAYDLVSMERPEDLADQPKVKQLEAQLAERGVSWHRTEYRAGGARSTLDNLQRLARLVDSATRRRDIALLHARSYVAGGIAAAVGGHLGVPYLFDVRGCWLDERVDYSRFFQNRQVLTAARVVERSLYQRAAGIVTLTQLHADAVTRGEFGTVACEPLAIPTCADYDDFRPDLPSRVLVPAAVRERLRARSVIGYIGSLNPSYKAVESFDLAAEYLRAREDGHLLILSGQPEEVSALARARGVASERMTVRTAHHAEMPEYLSLVDWGLLLLRESRSKLGSVPTKLGEFFAAGVRPVHFGCNDEVGEWVRSAGSGYSLGSLDRHSLRSAAGAMAALDGCGSTEAARLRTKPHFGLEAGLDRYAALVSALLARPRR